MRPPRPGKAAQIVADPISFRTFARSFRDLVRRAAALSLPLFALAACDAGGSSSATIPGDRADTKPYDGIGPDEIIHFSGTEPFWGGEVAGEKLVYMTPEKPEGETVVVGRFAGRGGLSYSGTLRNMAFTLAISPGSCSDGMSERTYPFLAMLKVGDAVRSGCAWTDKQRFKEGPA